MDLVCPAGNLPSLRAAVDNGADAVYIGFRDATNARHFAGLNFDDRALEQAAVYSRQHGVKLFVAINTYPQGQNWSSWQRAVDRAAGMSADALIIADLGVLDYATERYPHLPRHLSVQGSATNYEAIEFYKRSFGIRRVVLPRVLSMGQVRNLIERSSVPVEVFGFGSLCVMVEGRCLLSSYATGESPNTVGACSPAKAVEWRDTPRGTETRLGGVLIETYAPGEAAGYPTLCKGRYQVGESLFHAIEEPTSLNSLELLPDLIAAGVAAVKLEGRQRNAAYVAEVTRVWRAAIDACKRAPDQFKARGQWLATLERLSEGAQTTLGALHRPWQ